MTLLSKITGRQHHFKVVLRYYPSADGSRYVERVVNVWFQNKALISDDRKIKQALAGDLFSQTPSHLKQNGDLKIYAAYYLGWFKPKAGGEK
ncbi:hypothetical protein [Cycloclasticus pugetii]|uniref:hypothetical protein n=1 Tax=Cycloclasticus pugetii TaxID=34068 RepID=UPI003A94C636